MVPGVGDLCVVGAPDEERGEMPVAVVVIATGHDPDAVIAALQAHADERIGDLQAPGALRRRGRRCRRDDTGKLLRRQVRDALWGDESPFAVSVT